VQKRPSRWHPVWTFATADFTGDPVATIRKIEQKRGTRYQPIIRIHDEQLTRTFRRRSDATKWADKTEKTIEGENAGLVVEGHRSTQTTARYAHLVQDATHDLMRDTMSKVLASDE
jgi:hypothetical protein